MAANVGQIVMLCMMMVVMVHWIACLWFLVSTAADGWIAQQPSADGQWTEPDAPTFYTALMMVMGDSVLPRPARPPRPPPTTTARPIACPLSLLYPALTPQRPARLPR